MTEENFSPLQKEMVVLDSQLTSSQELLSLDWFGDWEAKWLVVRLGLCRAGSTG
ncbi:hypothetical protein MRB53_034517 [Persea americana]|uniref:Uncharacterized protein n=1 Tax=Persea americana TaxID=3435 RepID=A0ACC2K222_PERAE|nr:hypothetical protein MRB53_034517 [Persea americana]